MTTRTLPGDARPARTLTPISIPGVRGADGARTGGDARSPREHGTVPHGVAFWLTAFGYAVPMAFSAAPTPLYVLYQQRDHFSATTTTVVFAVYAIGVVASLLLAGHISDWVGRRRVLIPALGLSALSGLVFLAWPALPGLLLARLLTGLGVGAVAATATAQLAELNRAAVADRTGNAVVRPRGQGVQAPPSRRAELVATAANLGGIGLGPLIAGLLAQYAPDPLRTPYLVFLFLLVIAMIALSLVPETAPLPQRMPRYRIQRLAVPSQGRGTFFAAAVASLGSFAVFGLFTSLAPAVLTGLLHHSSHALAGAVAFAPFAAGAALQVLLVRARPATLLGIGGVLAPAGLVLVSAAVLAPSLPLFLIGGLVAGAGAGAIFKSSVSVVSGLSDEDRRAETLAGVFVAGYSGLAVPILGLGVATHFAGIRVSLVAFATVVIALVVPAVVGLRGRISRAKAQPR
jgi:MFS family permease